MSKRMETKVTNEKQDSNVMEETLHHKQLESCMTRPAYRQGRKFTAVKVYSISSESQHLFVYGVPAINLRSELKSLFQKYGEIITIHVVPRQKVEIFTECYHIHYKRIQSARIAKRFVDTKSFYGGVLHVCYAPEYETLEETTTKLLQRKKDVLIRLNKYNTALYEKHPEANVQNERKRSVHELSGDSQQEIGVHSKGDPISSYRKKQKKNNEETLLKYSSQLPDINGGPCNGMNYTFSKTSKPFLTLPLGYKTISADRVYGPQLPTRNTENSDGVSRQDKIEKIQDNLGGCDTTSSQKIIRKLPNNVTKRIIFRNKIQDKIS